MNFQLDDHGELWTASVKLPSWAGYLDRSGAYGGRGEHPRSDGRVELVFAPEGRSSDPLTPGEAALAEWFMKNEPAVSQAVKNAILEKLPELQTSAPRMQTTDDLRTNVGLYAINVHQIQRAGLPYVGFEFGCTWDDDHRLGVLMHGSRCVALGASDTAILAWIAEKDAAGYQTTAFHPPSVVQVSRLALTLTAEDQPFTAFSIAVRY